MKMAWAPSATSGNAMASTSSAPPAAPTRSPRPTSARRSPSSPATPTVKAPTRASPAPASGPIANVNDAPTGAVTISWHADRRSDAHRRNTLADEDGLGAISYQWQRNGVDIAGATGSTYTLTQADVGTTITVVASYTDGQGTGESVTSAGVGPVANVNDAPTGTVTISGTPTEDQTLTASQHPGR